MFRGMFFFVCTYINLTTYRKGTTPHERPLILQNVSVRVTDDSKHIYCRYKVRTVRIRYVLRCVFTV